MSKPQDRSVYPLPNGRWANQRHDQGNPENTHDTQEAAIAKARSDLSREGGGELSVHGRDGQIRQKDTVPPGHDPRNTPG